jgi:hypothetical protein
MLTYMISLAVYPGLALNMPWFGIDSQWLSFAVVGIWNVFDCAGRFLCNVLPLMSKETLRLLTVLRCFGLLTVILAMPAFGITYLQQASWYSLLNLVVLGFSNGIVGTMEMIQGTMNTKDVEVAGYIMAFHLTLGLALGSILATLLSYVVL